MAGPVQKMTPEQIRSTLLSNTRIFQLSEGYYKAFAGKYKFLGRFTANPKNAGEDLANFFYNLSKGGLPPRYDQALKGFKELSASERKTLFSGVFQHKKRGLMRRVVYYDDKKRRFVMGSSKVSLPPIGFSAERAFKSFTAYSSRNPLSEFFAKMDFKSKPVGVTDKSRAGREKVEIVQKLYNHLRKIDTEFKNKYKKLKFRKGKLTRSVRKAIERIQEYLTVYSSRDAVFRATLQDKGMSPEFEKSEKGLFNEKTALVLYAYFIPEGKWKNEISIIRKGMTPTKLKKTREEQVAMLEKGDKEIYETHLSKWLDQRLAGEYELLNLPNFVAFVREQMVKGTVINRGWLNKMLGKGIFRNFINRKVRFEVENVGNLLFDGRMKQVIDKLRLDDFPVGGVHTKQMLKKGDNLESARLKVLEMFLSRLYDVPEFKKRLPKKEVPIEGKLGDLDAVHKIILEATKYLQRYAAEDPKGTYRKRLESIGVRSIPVMNELNERSLKVICTYLLTRKGTDPSRWNEEKQALLEMERGRIKKPIEREPRELSELVASLETEADKLLYKREIKPWLENKVTGRNPEYEIYDLVGIVRIISDSKRKGINPTKGWLDQQLRGGTFDPFMGKRLQFNAEEVADDFLRGRSLYNTIETLLPGRIGRKGYIGKKLSAEGVVSRLNAEKIRAVEILLKGLSELPEFESISEKLSLVSVNGYYENEEIEAVKALQDFLFTKAAGGELFRALSDIEITSRGGTMKREMIKSTGSFDEPTAKALAAFVALSKGRWSMEREKFLPWDRRKGRERPF